MTEREAIGLVLRTALNAANGHEHCRRIMEAVAIVKESQGKKAEAEKMADLHWDL